MCADRVVERCICSCCLFCCSAVRVARQNPSGYKDVINQLCSIVSKLLKASTTSRQFERPRLRDREDATTRAEQG